MLLIGAALIGCQGEVGPGVNAQTPSKMADPATGDSLLPSPGHETLKRSRLLAKDLSDTIERLEGVAEARVHLDLADRSLFSRRPEAKSSAAILIRRNNAAKPTQETIKELVAAAVSDVDPNAVRVFFAQSTTHPLKTVFIGPIEVAETSATRAKLWFGGLIGLSLVLAAGLVFAGIKLRASRSKTITTP
ncbi:MAG: hypothetical protein QNJ97_16740 [Myxococcota bacterium]|nr:hypothetical protein [Myxococcota bacterium]